MTSDHLHVTTLQCCADLSKTAKTFYKHEHYALAYTFMPG